MNGEFSPTGGALRRTRRNDVSARKRWLEPAVLQESAGWSERHRRAPWLGENQVDFRLTDIGERGRDTHGGQFDERAITDQRQAIELRGIERKIPNERH